MLKYWENNVTEEIGLVTPTPGPRVSNGRSPRLMWCHTTSLAPSGVSLYIVYTMRCRYRQKHRVGYRPDPNQIHVRLLPAPYKPGRMARN